MPKSIIISIPKPCSEDWEQMTPQNNGRFCAHCSKTVIDFNTWTDAALLKYFAEAPQYLCGRFSAAQLGRKISIRHQPHSALYRLAIALGLTLVFTQRPTFAQTAARPPLQQQTISSKSDSASKVDTMAYLLGRVVDNKGEPVVSASVAVMRYGKIVAGAVTDYDGYYTVNGLDSGTYDVEIIALSNEKKTITDVHIAAAQTSINVMLGSMKNITLGAFIVSGAPLLIDPYETKTIIRSTDLHNRR